MDGDNEVMAAVDLSVLVPVYNNASTLNELIDRLLAVLEPLDTQFELILVDDGSRDESLIILQQRAAADSRIRPFALIRNFGSQAASCAACEQVRGRRVVHIDADLEAFPEDIPRLLQRLDEGYDLVCGYRESRTDPWLTRRLPSLLINAYVRHQTGTNIRDVGCSLRAMDAALIRNLSSEGEARRLLTPVLLRRARRIVQVPVRHQPKPHRGGHSFLSLLGIAADYYLLTAGRPFLLTGAASGLLLALASLLLIFGPPLEGLLLAGIALLGGILSLTGEYVQRIYHLVQGVPFYELKEIEQTGVPNGSATPFRMD